MIQWIDTYAMGRVFVLPFPDGQVAVSSVEHPDSDLVIPFDQIPTFCSTVAKLSTITVQGTMVAIGSGGGDDPFCLTVDEITKLVDALEAIMPELSLYHEAWEQYKTTAHEGKHRGQG